MSGSQRNSWSSPVGSLRSAVSNPSVNQPLTTKSTIPALLRALNHTSHWPDNMRRSVEAPEGRARLRRLRRGLAGQPGRGELSGQPVRLRLVRPERPLDLARVQHRVGVGEGALALAKLRALKSAAASRAAEALAASELARLRIPTAARHQECGNNRRGSRRTRQSRRRVSALPGVPRAKRCPEVGTLPIGRRLLAHNSNGRSAISTVALHR
jgi:hypothetical protein